MVDYTPLGGGMPMTGTADPRTRIALAMMQSGTDYSPVRSWTQGAARVANALLGGMMYRQQQEENSKAIGDLLGAFAGGGAPALSMSDANGVPAPAASASPAAPATPMGGMYGNSTAQTAGGDTVPLPPANPLGRLNPEFRDKFADLRSAAADQGVNFNAPDDGSLGGVRTPDQQAALYAQGRTAPGPVVTGTMHSNHLTGQALDVVPTDGSTSKQIGNTVTDLIANDPRFAGMRSGATFSNLYDPLHIELNKPQGTQVASLDPSSGVPQEPSVSSGPQPATQQPQAVPAPQVTQAAPQPSMRPILAQNTSAIPPNVAAAVQRALASGSPVAQQMAAGILSRYMVPPQYDLMQQADGTVMAVNKLNPRDNYVAFKGTAKPIAVAPGATLVTPGSSDQGQGGQSGASGSFQPVYQNKTGLFDKDTLTSMADQYLTGDKSVLQNLGRTAIGGMNISALRERIVSRAKEMGISPTEVASRIGQFDSYTAAQRATGTRGGNVTMAATEAANLGNLVNETSAAVPRTNYPVWNKVTNAYAENTGDPNIVKFTGALNSYINAYARAINPSGSTTVSDKEHAREILDTAMSHGQIEAGIGQLQKELEQAKAAPASSSETIKKEFLQRSDPRNSEVLSQAKAAIAQGADRDAVAKRLRGMGIDPSGL